MAAREKTGFLITNGRVMTGGDGLHEPSVHDILIEGDTITRVEPGLARTLPEDSRLEIVDATDRLIAPGFVNAHYHSHDVLAKGTMEEMPLEAWRILALPPQYPKPSRAEVKTRTLLGALECLHSGITTVQDMVTLSPFDPDHLDAVVEAYEEIGIRAAVALQYADLPGIDTTPFWREVFPEEMHPYVSAAAEPERERDPLASFEETFLESGRRFERIFWALGPSAPERCSAQLVERTAALAERHDLPVFTHIYESKAGALQARRGYPGHGGSLIRRLRAEGLLGPRLNLAHSVWLLPEEIEILAETGTNVIINPLSNMKLKSGIAPIRALQEAGVSLGLGCDNCSCSDAQNMFQAMKLFALLTAISHPEPGPAQAVPAFEAATRGGAHALGRSHELGRIAPGFKADLVFLDLRDPSFVPLNSAVRQLVYTEAGRSVESVMVDGRFVIRDRECTTLDRQALLEQVTAVMSEFRKHFADVRARVEKLRPHLEEAHRRIWAEDVGNNRLFTGR